MTKESSAVSVQELGVSSLDYASIEEAFPEIDPEFLPFGDKVLVQIKAPMLRTKSGFFLPPETREAEQWNTQVAKVIRIGPVAFCNRDTLQPWPEKAWCKEGDFIRVPKYGGDRWEVPIPGRPGEYCIVVNFRDVDLGGKITGDPLKMIAYLK